MKYTTLLSLQQQRKDLSWCCCKAWTAWLCWACICWFLYNELVMLSFPSFPFIVFFLQVFWSKFAILLRFFSKKTNHFLTKPSTLFLFPVSLSSYPFIRFHVSPNLSIAFFPYFLSFLFFVFDIRLSFWVSATVLRSLSSNLSIRSSRTCSFSDSSSRSRPVPLTFCLVFDLFLFMSVVKLYLRPCIVTANSSQLFKLLAIFPISRFTFLDTLCNIYRKAPV